MRAALWLLALFGVAVAVALFAGNNQGTVTLFWPPYRVDLSLNLVLLVLAAAFVFLHAALRALAALFDLPRQALRWRNQQKERAMYAAVLDAMSQLVAGRFLRSRKSAQSALAQERALSGSGEKPANGTQIRVLSHLLAAESAQALQDRSSRDEHLRLALDEASQRPVPAVVQETHEGALLRAARWALDDRDPPAAMTWLGELPQGAARRTLALRIKLKAARQARQTGDALDTARLLAKHQGFSKSAAQGLLRSLAFESLDTARDVEQLRRVWTQLDALDRIGTRTRPVALLEAPLRALRDRPEPRVVVREPVAQVGRAGARERVVGEGCDFGVGHEPQCTRRAHALLFRPRRCVGDTGCGAHADANAAVVDAWA